MILILGDKTSAKTARAALDKCKQGSTSIIDYNSRFRPLSFQVRQHEDDAIIKYVGGLHPDVREECINVQGWNVANTLAEKMNLAIEGATRADERASLPNKMNRPRLYQHPHKQNVVTYPIHVPINKPVSVPVTMEIDAIHAKVIDRKSPFTSIGSVCIKRGLCFKCIQPSDEETHMQNGERICRNKNTSLSEKLALLTEKDLAEHQDSTKNHQIAAVSFEDQVEADDCAALEELGEGEREAVDWLLENYCSGLFQPIYPPPSDLMDDLEVHTVKIEADRSTPRRVNVAMTLREKDCSIPVMVIADTGSMTNLLDESFVKKNGMNLLTESSPLSCKGYDGKIGEYI